VIGFTYDEFVSSQGNDFLKGLSFIALSAVLIVMTAGMLGLLFGLFIFNWKIGLISIGVFALIEGITLLGKRV